MNFKIIVILFFLIITLNNIYSYQSVEPLNTSAVKVQAIDVDMNIHLPISITNYGVNDTLVFKTRTFRDTSSQKADFQNYYYDNAGNKIFARIEEDEFNNKYAIFEINPITRNEYIFKIQGNVVSESNHVFNNETYDLSEPITNEIAGENVEFFMQPTRFIKSSEQEIINTVENIKQSNDALSELIFFTNWANHNIEYDLTYADVMLDAVEVLKNRKGVCNEISILTAALLRARGFPVKYVVGIASTSEFWGPHAWLEVFIPGQGWILVDPTYNEVGFVDGTHIVLAKLRDSSESEDIITTRSNTLSVNFEEKELFTNINDLKTFSESGYESFVNIEIDSPSRMKSGSMLDVKLILRNTTANPITLFGKLLVHDDFQIINRKNGEVFLLQPFEEITKNYFYILPNISQTLSYSMKYLTQFKDVEEYITVGPNERIFNSTFFVKDPFIYFTNGELIVEIDVYNYTLEKKNLTFEFVFPEETLEYQKLLEENTHEQFVYVLPMIEEGEIDFYIKGDYQYHKKINVLPGQELVILDNNQTNEINIVDQNQSELTQEYEDVFKNIDEKEEERSSETNSIFVIILAIVFLILIVFIIIKTRFKK